MLLMVVAITVAITVDFKNIILILKSVSFSNNISGLSWIHFPMK